MSTEARKWARSQTHVTGNRYMVLMSLAEMARKDQGHSCYPSIETIAADAHVSRSTAARALDDLEALGAITRERRTDAKGHQAPNLYTVNIGDAQNVKTAPSQNVNLTPGQNVNLTLRETNPRMSTVTHKKEVLKNLSNTSEVKYLTHSLDAREKKSAFDRIWESWPRKENARQARMALTRALEKEPDESALVETIILFGQAFARGNPKFVPGLSRWLDDERWKDQLPVQSIPLTDRTINNHMRLASWANEPIGGTS